MSRATLAVVALLVVVSVLGWYQPWSTAPVPGAVPPPRPAPPPPVAPAPEPVAAPVPATDVAAEAPPATIRDEADLAAFLTARGIRADQAIAELRAWRARRGFAGPDPRTGLAPEGAADYAALDEATLAGLAAGGDASAVQALAYRKLPGDPFGALEGLRAAAALGSAAALLEIGAVIGTLAELPPDAIDADPTLRQRVRELKREDPAHDLRIDALAWRLAAARQYGPAVLDGAQVGDIEAAAADLGPDAVATACAQSLAIMAGLGARDPLPAVFPGEVGVYRRLPCGDSAAPIVPPAGTANCPRTRVLDRNGQPFALWTCRAD